MQITVTGKQIELSDNLREKVWSDLEALAKRYSERDFLLAQVTFRRERRFFLCDISLQIHGLNNLRSHSSAEDAYQAFKQTVEPIQKRLAEARSRRYSRRSESAADIGFRSLMRPEPDEGEDVQPPPENRT